MTTSDTPKPMLTRREVEYLQTGTLRDNRIAETIEAMVDLLKTVTCVCFDNDSDLSCEHCVKRYELLNTFNATGGGK
jgi:hypothetical protein